ncbi:cobalamin biosynthesis protein CobW [Paenibacillus sp. FSL A5-0031]|uniref:CobW family GTP-binding protein n=1 Tax=Paenibacillus sp. FSL A5-0031 TaxID=1920420 RepID=UPI00096E4257|nr:GTP-binding protein [Paenibacillus sp. FSL A5-0031]OME79091.1 cobalamin biosynthesis protein CobW [Paenibacillus sp. FSL A5-0031]
MTNREKHIPVHLLSGFLGSGKTTLLRRLLDYYTAQGMKPAVIMNELGDINLDGQLVGDEVPMAEMLSGCICCTMRGDLGMEISMLIDEHKPDVIFIESTGAANPMETLDGITEAAMYKEIDLRSVITIVDGPELLSRSRDGKGRTFKLMLEQIKCATILLLNKADKLEPDQLVEAQQQLRELNAHAQIIATVRCAIDDWSWLETAENTDRHEPVHASDEALDIQERASAAHSHSHDSQACSVAGCTHDHGDAVHSHDDDLSSHNHSSHHHSHDHVMVVTHYWRGPVSSEAFESLLQKLPANIYRAKGIVTFTDAPSRFLFQYAYKESDFMRIEPQGHVNDVAVFIGEHFSKEWLQNELELLEQHLNIETQG